MTPTVLNNRYRVVQVLASGGFGDTFLAEDSFLPSNRLCVIKQLKLLIDIPQVYEIVRERFRREAVILEELGRGNSQIPELYAYFEEVGRFYLVQEWVEGQTLGHKVRTESILSELAVKQLLEKILPVLSYLHGRGIIHRDIKPDNIILRRRDGLPILIDFGAVKESVGVVLNSQGQTNSSSIVIGTPGYMPPEQGVGHPVFSSDLYSLGLTAVYLLTGKLPQNLPTNHRTGEFAWRWAAPAVSERFAEILERTIQYHPRDRFATAEDILTALQALVSSRPSTFAAPSPVPASVLHSTSTLIPPISPASPLSQPLLPIPDTIPQTKKSFAEYSTHVATASTELEEAGFKKTVLGETLILRQQAQQFQMKFAKSLEQQANQPVVFHVHGIGGVGKTELLKELRIENAHKAYFTEHLFFEQSSDIETPLKLMAKLYEDIEKVSRTNIRLQGVLFPLDPFTSLYKKYEQTLYQLKMQPAEGKGTISVEQRSTVRELVKLGFSAVGQIMPVSGLTSSTLEKIAETSFDTATILLSQKDNWQQFLQRHWATRKKRELQELILSPLSKLTQAFAEGLISKAKERPIVLVLDTFEKASPDINTWLWKYLLANTALKDHKVRLLIAGRYNLLKAKNWGRLNQNLQLVYECGLEEFDEHQTHTYLVQQKVNEPVQKIYRITKGLPYHLDRIYKEKKKGKSISFSQGYDDEILDIFLPDNPTEKRIIQLGACCRWFDGKLLKYLIDRQEEKLDFRTAVDEKYNCFEWLIQQDFVVKGIQHGYCLDDVARGVFRLSLWRSGHEFLDHTHALIASYFEEKAIQRILPNSCIEERLENPDWCNYKVEATYHRFFAQPDTQLFQFLEELFVSPLYQSKVMRAAFTAIAAEANIEEYPFLSHESKQFLLDYEKTALNVNSAVGTKKSN